MGGGRSERRRWTKRRQPFYCRATWTAPVPGEGRFRTSYDERKTPCGSLEIQTDDCVRGYELRRVAGAKERRGRATTGGGGVAKIVSGRRARSQFKPDGHGRACAGDGGARGNTARGIPNAGGQTGARH